MGVSEPHAVSIFGTFCRRHGVCMVKNVKSSESGHTCDASTPLARYGALTDGRNVEGCRELNNDSGGVDVTLRIEDLEATVVKLEAINKELRDKIFVLLSEERGENRGFAAFHGRVPSRRGRRGKDSAVYKYLDVDVNEPFERS